MQELKTLRRSIQLKEEKKKYVSIDQNLLFKVFMKSNYANKFMLNNDKNNFIRV